MSKTYHLAILIGSNQRDSINRQLGEAMARLFPHNFKISYPRIDDLPLYCQDLEPERTASVNRFTGEITAADAILLVTPEHNRSIPAALKNALDWGSKPHSIWIDKPVAITGASPGAIGTAVAQQHLRQVMGVLGSLVMGGEVYLQYKPGLVVDGEIGPDSRDFIKGYLDRFVSLIEKVCN